MATPQAAAALFQAALPREASGSGSGGDGLGKAIRGRGGRGRGRGGRAGHGSARDEDVGMSDASEGGAMRRGRQSARHSSGPMGQRVSRPPLSFPFSLLSALRRAARCVAVHGEAGGIVLELWNATL